MYRALTVWLIAIIAAGYFLFAMKREVETLNFASKELQKQINFEKNTINLLKAEFCYLTSPQRLRKLSDTHLELASLTPERMAHDPLKEQHENAFFAIKTQTVEPQPNPQVKMVKWRYKPMANKTLNKNIKHAALNLR